MVHTKLIKTICKSIVLNINSSATIES